MRLLEIYRKTETDRCVKNGVRLSVIGRHSYLKSFLERFRREWDAEW